MRDYRKSFCKWHCHFRLLTFFVWLCASLGFCQNFFIIFSTSSELLSPFLLSDTIGG